MGSLSLIINSIVSTQFIRWCIDESQIIKLWSNATDFLGVKGTRDELAWENLPGTRDELAWGNLPSELWAQIGKGLLSRLDILRFRSVCKEWRSSLPHPTRFPVRVPPPPNCDPKFCNVPYMITEVNMYKSRRLLVSFEGLDRGSRFHPAIMTRRGKFNYPKISTMAKPPLSQLSFVAKAYHLRMDMPCPPYSHVGTGGRQLNFPYNKFVRKIVLISSDANSVNPSYASDLIVVAHLNWGKMKGRLALLRLGGPPENWVWDTDFCSGVYVDIATYKGQLCTLDGWGRVFFMDYNSLQMTQVCGSSSVAYQPENKHMFEASGDLYLADFSLKKTPDRSGHKLSLRLHKWLKVEDLGDNRLPIGPFFML